VTGSSEPADRVLGAVDIGTNSLHLLVARVLPDQRFEVLASEKEAVRLGSGSGDMKHLSDDAIDRGVACLARFRQMASIYGAELRAVATSAVREAENQAEFLERCRSEAGVVVEVISGVEEARLIHLGVLQALPLYDRQLLLMDIGGGSTEFLVGKAGEALWARSLKLGAIRLTERFFPEGRVTPKKVERARQYLHSFLAPSMGEIMAHGFDVAVGSSGTIENVAVVAAQLRDGKPPLSANGLTFSRDDLNRATEVLLSAPTAAERARIPGVEAKRADIIAGGALLLQVAFEELDLQAMTLSSYALREGVLLDGLSQLTEAGLHHLTDLRRSSVEHLLNRFETQRPHAEWSTELALQLFDATRQVHGLRDEALDYLEAGGLLANIGRAIAHDAHHKHSYYLIRHTEALMGFTSHEVELIAQLARYHRKSAPAPKHAEFAALSPADQHLVRVLAGLLRLGIALDRGQHRVVRSVRTRLDANGEKLVIEAVVDDPAQAALELYTADATKGLAESALGRQIEVRAARPGRA
jgi:exopolyphosphatase/guanosine-5'-triphosphate,3'-diphosphate pyrophosphatase